MRKAGKVTVKHYLEKKVKPVEIYGDTMAYPVYVRITVNRRTTQIRSITDTLMSEGAFKYYEETGKVYNYETSSIGNINLLFRFEQEQALIQRSIEILSDRDEDYNFSDGNVRSHLMYMLTSARKAFIQAGWGDSPSIVDGNVSLFVYSFSQEESLINSIKNVGHILNIDLRSYIPSDVLKMWQVIELVKCIAKNEMPFVYFYDRDYEMELIDAKAKPKVRDYCLIDEQYSVTDEEVKRIVKKLVRYYFFFTQ